MSALFTHHHYGWRKHDLPNSDSESLRKALMATHDFLEGYRDMYSIETELTPDRSYDGVVRVRWNSTTACPASTFYFPIGNGDIWFRAFEFNVADSDACRFCGGTGMDHYVGPFFHCWACDGTARQLRQSTPRGFKHRPTHHAAQSTCDEYAAVCGGAS